jgi:plastocyanin
MKKFAALFILAIAFMFLAGCTQSATTAPTTTVQTTVPTTVPQTTIPTVVSTTIVPTTVVPNTTAVITTVPTTATPIPTETNVVIPTPTTRQVEITTIDIINNTFVPDSLTVLPGTGVTWVNEDLTTHQVNAIGNATGMFNSGDIITGGNFINTFINVGSYQFADPKYNITGTINVIQAPAFIGNP